MIPPRRTLHFVGILSLFVASVASAAAVADEHAEFIKGNALVMARMMAAMDVAPQGDVDVDFVNLMEPHHRAAVEMAELELRYGRNQQLRRIAQEIIVEQQQEIVAMRLAIGRPIGPSNLQDK